MVIFSLVDSEIAAQKEMLKEADKTLNQILSKMETEVDELDPDQLDDHSSPVLNSNITEICHCVFLNMSLNLIIFQSDRSIRGVH